MTPLRWPQTFHDAFDTSKDNRRRVLRRRLLADEPASELLKRIEAKKRELVEAKVIRKPKLLPDLDTSPLSFTLPRGWCWARTDELSPRSLTDGDWIETKDQSQDGNVRLIQLADVGVGAFLDKSARFVTEETEIRLRCTRLTVGDILIARLPNPIGRACVFPDVGQPAITAVDVAILRADENSYNRYIEAAINAPSTREQIEAYGKGATRFRVSTGHLKTVVLPLPPLAEQRRIVAKVDELMTLCDRLKETRAVREDSRDRLTRASLTRLTTTDTDASTFRAHARFAINALPSLTARADQVKQLRRTILRLAVRGKLVEQDPADEPASRLLKRIEKGKARLARSNRTRKSQPLPAVDGREMPFQLPSTWRWVYFGNIVEFAAGRTPPRKEAAYWNTGDFPWVSIADMTDGETVRSTRESVSVEARLNVFKREPVPAGTMIMSFKLTIGKIARLGVAAFHNEAIISIWPGIAELNPFLFRILPGFARSATAKGAVKGATLNRQSLSRIMVPLPSLPEQRRIVAKVDELMGLCDRMETNLGIADDTHSRLLEAILHDALGSTQPKGDQRTLPA